MTIFSETKKRKRAHYISSSRLRIQTAHWFPLPWQFFDYSFIIENLISLLAYFLSCLLLRLYYNKFIASMSILFGKFRTMEAELSANPFPKSQAIVLQKFIKGGRSRYEAGLSSLISLSFSGSEKAAVFCPWDHLHKKNQKAPKSIETFWIGIRRLPTLPGRCHPSTIGDEELNYCVRDGNRWVLFAIATVLAISHLLKMKYTYSLWVF